MQVKIFYIHTDTPEGVIQTKINEWLKRYQDTITILHIFQSSENADTIISIWYKKSTHVV